MHQQQRKDDFNPQELHSLVGERNKLISDATLEMRIEKEHLTSKVRR